MAIDHQVMGTGASEIAACEKVAGMEFRKECAKCNPFVCDGRGADPFAGVVTADEVVAQGSVEPEFTISSTSSVYCFPEYSNRKRYENVWGSYIVE